MKPVATAVRKDEKAWRLTEIHLVRPPLHQWHRYQIVVVNRNDQLAEFWTDLGPSDFAIASIDIPSLWEHSVAELREIAEHARQQDDYWRKRAVEIQAESTLIPDYLNQLEERWAVINNQSVFGPGVARQRNGFSKEAAYESAGRN